MIPTAELAGTGVVKSEDEIKEYILVHAPNGNGKSSISMLQWVLGFVIASLAWVCLGMAEIKGNIFTSQDGLAIWKEISSIRQKIASMPTEAPPAWFVQDVNELKSDVKSLTEDLHKYTATNK